MLFQKNAAGWLIVGLGNPEDKYRGTRHNAGFAAIDALAAQLRVPAWKKKFQAEIAACKVDGESVVLMKPLTYMNLSGNAVSEAARFYKLPPEHIIVLVDDISLAVGRLRVRADGSAGGHNGLKSIIAQLGSQSFPRVKIGVGAKPHPDTDLAEWVLAGFPAEQRPIMEESYKRAGQAALDILSHDAAYAANRYNGA